MSENSQLASSTDAREKGDAVEMNYPNLLTVSRKSLKDNLNPRVSHVIKVLDLATNNPTVRLSSTVAPTVPTILNETGQIDINKFTDTIIQSNVSMTKALNSTNDFSQQYLNYQQSRILENPPILKNCATYLDYYNWIDPMLANLKRHPDFRYQYLMYDKPKTSTPEDQLRLDQVYDIIKDKLDFSVSQNPKLMGLLSCHPSSDQISNWWLLLQIWFFPRSESEKQTREMRFYNLIQKVDESNEEFIQRVCLEAEILKYCNQEVSEPRLRLCINTGLTDRIHKEYATLQDQLNFNDWINYVIKLERVHKPNRIDPFAPSIDKTVPVVAVAESGQKSNPKKVTYSKESDGNAKGRNMSKHKKKIYKKSDSWENTCFICYGKGHYKATCPYKTKTVAELIKVKAKNKREYQANKYRNSDQSSKDVIEHTNNDDNRQRFQQYKKSLTLPSSKSIEETDMIEDDPSFVGVIIDVNINESLLLLDNTLTPQSSNNPIFDSGATRHMFNNLAHFSEFVPYSGEGMQVEVAQGARIPVIGTGNVGPLTNVLYIPDLKFSVISISTLDNMNYHTLFSKGTVSIFDSEDKLFLKGSKNSHGLYVLQQSEMEQSLNLPPIVCVVHQYSQDPYLNIHACLGHASARRTRYVCKCNNIKGLKSMSIRAFNSIVNCESCKLAKSTKRKFPGHFETPTIPGQIWQFDVKGKIEVPSIMYNCHYEFGFIDLCSRKLFTYYTTNKDSDTTVAVLRTWFNNVIIPIRASNSLVTKVFLHSDLGELDSQITRDFCLSNGIYLTFTSAYTPELNSIIERVWRTITESSVAMLIHAKLSEFYWQFARQTAVYIYNAIPGSHPEKQPLSPDERFYGRRTNIQHLKIFGTTCYVNIMNKKKDHYQRSIRGIFVGYSLDQPLCYKVFISGPPSRVVVSTHVTFVCNPSLTNESSVQEESNDDNVPLEDGLTASSRDKGILSDNSSSSDGLSTSTSASRRSNTVTSESPKGLLTSSTSPNRDKLESPAERLPTSSKESGSPMTRLPTMTESPMSDKITDVEPTSSPTNTVAPSHLNENQLPEYNDNRVQSDLCSRDPTKTDHLSSGDPTYLIGKLFRDDEDELIYKVLSIYKYKGYLAVTRGLVLSNGNVVKVNDPIWVGDAIKLVDDYEKDNLPKLLYVTLPNMINYKSNTYSIDDCTFATDKFRINDDVCLLLTNIANSGDAIVSNVLETGVSATEIGIPSTHKQAMSSPHAHQWQVAENNEIHSLEKKNVLKPSILPEGQHLLTTRWIYRVKYRQDGSIDKFKARLVARGYEQILGIDYDETFSPVVRLTSVRIILALSIQHNLILHTMDVDTAFLNAPLEEEIYIRPPTGFTLPPGKTCFKLIKALYGLKQSPRAWNIHLNGHLEKFGFKKLISDTCVYIKRYESDLICIIAIYVDDLLIAGSNITIINDIKNLFKSSFQMKDLGPINNLLGCRILQNMTIPTISMDQSFYTKNILKTFFPEGINPTEVPMSKDTVLSVADCPTSDEEKENMFKFPYRQAVGSLIWLASGTRPDIAYAVSQVARFNANPGIVHWKAVVKIFRYLQGTTNMGIKYSPTPHESELLNVIGYSDSDHARCVDTRRSITGYMFMMSNGPISWQSKQQTSVALSSMEAEYMALCAATQEAIWLRMILTDFDRRFNESVVIHEDNQSCIEYTKNPTQYKRTKHIDQKYHFVKDEVLMGTIKITKIATNDNLADIFTKPLEVNRFHYLLSQFLSRVM